MSASPCRTIGALALLAASSCAPSGPISVGSILPAEGSGGASVTCGALVVPTVVASCDACDDEPAECAPNGCSDGFLCDTSRTACVPPTALSGCPREAPIDCVEARGQRGCCGADGQRYFCENEDNFPLSQVCAVGTCGWSPKTARYACDTEGGIDPGGSPKHCALEHRTD